MHLRYPYTFGQKFAFALRSSCTVAVSGWASFNLLLYRVARLRTTHPFLIATISSLVCNSASRVAIAQQMIQLLPPSSLVVAQCSSILSQFERTSFAKVCAKTAAALCQEIGRIVERKNGSLGTYWSASGIMDVF